MEKESLFIIEVNIISLNKVQMYKSATPLKLIKVAAARPIKNYCVTVPAVPQKPFPFRYGAAVEK